MNIDTFEYVDITGDHKVCAVTIDIEEGDYDATASIPTLTIPSVFEGVKITELNSFLAFNGVKKPCNLVVSEGITKIQQQCFTNNSFIVSITLPKSIKKVDQHAFQGCTGLTEVIFHPECPLNSIETRAFSLNKQLKTVNLPLGIDEIGAHAFEDCTSLKEINLSELDSLTDIHEHAFSHTGLESVTLPANVKSIDAGAFSFNKYLVSVNLQKCLSLMFIPGSCFYACTKLKTVKLPKVATGIGPNAFSVCSSLESIDMRKTIITQIGHDAFYKSGLKSVYFTKNKLVAYVSIGECAFMDTPLEKTNVFDGSEITFSMLIYKNAFRKCGFTELIIPDTVQLVEDNIFYRNKKLKSVVFKDGDDELIIPENTFMGCIGLESVHFAKNTSEIQKCAFKNTNIKDIDLGDTEVRKIYSFAFPKTLRSLNIHYSSIMLSASAVCTPNELELKGLVAKKPFAELMA